VVDLTEPASAGQQADEAAHAVPLHHRALIVPEGTIIPAVLETTVDTTAPGPVRAITSSDTRGFDGSRIVIPKGSRLLGDSRADVQSGQSRILINWTKLVRPDGVSVKIGSPVADREGQVGVAGAVNNHAFARISSAVLQSALMVGVNLASRPGNGSVIVGAPMQAAAGATAPALLPDADAKPSISVKRGTDISVFVAHDLDFAGVAQWR
jgi:type IV secretion system protein VirB10